MPIPGAALNVSRDAPSRPPAICPQLGGQRFPHRAHAIALQPAPSAPGLPWWIVHRRGENPRPRRDRRYGLGLPRSAAWRVRRFSLLHRRCGPLTPAIRPQLPHRAERKTPEAAECRARAFWRLPAPLPEPPSRPAILSQRRLYRAQDLRLWRTWPAALVITSQIGCDHVFAYCPLQQRVVFCSATGPAAGEGWRTMRAHHTRWWAWMPLLIAATLTASAAAGEIIVKFSLDYGFEGPAALFVNPLDKGYYRSEGLNVTISPAANSIEPVERVASGEYDIGFGDINTLIRYRDAKPSAPVKAVLMVYNRPPFAVIGRKSRGVVVPKDLEGKTLGAPASDGSFAQWPIFVQVNGIDASKVKIENVSFPVRDPMLAAGQVDAITGYSFTTFVDLKDKGVPVGDLSVLLMADYGVELYGNAIIVNSKFAAEHPDAVKGFLNAFMRGLRETVKNPAAAIDSVLRRNPDARKNVELERLTMAIRENIVTPEVKANGYGTIEEQRFARALDQIALAYKFKNAKPRLDDVFDSSFLPALKERKFN